LRIVVERYFGSTSCSHATSLPPSQESSHVLVNNNSSQRGFLARVGLGIGAAIAALLALPSLAQAHVTVQPGTAEGGGFSVVAFRVPNERDDANTTQLRVTLPEDQPIGSVQTTAVPGWKITTATRHLDKPIEMFGNQLDTVVSEVTWTATAGGIRPGQFQDFDLSLGQLPESGDLVFSALQTYSSGEKVNWNQVSTDPSVEPEYPAPILRITPASTEEGATVPDIGSGADQDEQGQDEQVTSAAQSNEGSDSTLTLVVSSAALALSLVAVGLAWRLGRRPAPAAEAASLPTPRQDASV
jgi:uncharacterized protein YcnI